ncbi:MAG: HAD family phosphatase [Chloroflexota bacterium]|nr:HAD family phosphatase [Chloroflexota bacterium]
MPIRAVIFDMGGVILRTESQQGRRKWESRLGLKERELAQIVFGSEVSARASIGLGTDADVWKNVASILHLSDAQLEELERDFWSGDRIDDALVQFIHDLHPRYKTAILSNAWSGARAAISNKYGLGAVVDAIITSAEEGVAKPDARIYRLAAERLGVLPGEAVFVDDVAENVDAARAVGMRGVQFKSTAQAIAEVRSHLNDGV